MATKKAIDQRKRLDAADVSVDLSIDDQKVKLRFSINDDFSKKARDYIDKLINSRDIDDPNTITKMNAAVTKLAELAPPMAKPADDDLPSWMRAGLQAQSRSPLDWALGYIRKDAAQSQQNATIDGFIAALAATCQVILTDEDGNELETLNGGIYVHTKSKKNVGLTFVSIRPEIQCEAIPDDYFDDTDNNVIRRDNMLPDLPARIPFHPVEQKVAWLATLRDQHDLFSLQLETFFNRYINVLMEAAFNVARQDADDEGFHGSDVDPDVEKKTGSTGKRTRRKNNSAQS